MKQAGWSARETSFLKPNSSRELGVDTTQWSIDQLAPEGGRHWSTSGCEKPYESVAWPMVEFKLKFPQLCCDSLAPV